MKIVNLKTTIAALAVLALTIPAAGSAHPSLYLIVGKVANKAEVQTLTVNATGGTYKPSAGAKTIPWNAPSWQVQDALGFDGAIGRNAVNGQANVLVTGPNGGPYNIRFQGALVSCPNQMSNINQAQLVPSSTGLTGGTSTASVTTVTEGTCANTTYTTDSTGATLQDTPQQALIVNDGYATLWTESNGLTDHGWLNLKFAPGGFRAPMTGLEWITYGNIQTGIQTHATCQNVPALNTNANAQAVQHNFGVNAAGDPFWNYVPWQKTIVPVGGEDPTKWTDVAKTATNGVMGAPAGGVDFATLTSVADFRTACENMAGIYVPADTQGGNQASAMIADAVAPLNTQITTLTGQVTTLTAEKAQLEADLEQAENERDALLNRPLDVVLSSSKSKGKVVVMVSGPFSASTSLKLQISEADRKKLKLPSRTIATATRGFGLKGAAIATLTPGSKAAKAIAKRTVATKFTVLATSGVLTDSAKGSIS